MGFVQKLIRKYYFIPRKDIISVNTSPVRNKFKKKNELFLSTINNIHINKYFFDNFRNNITFLIIIFTTNEPLSCTTVAIIK